MADQFDDDSDDGFDDDFAMEDQRDTAPAGEAARAASAGAGFGRAQQDQLKLETIPRGRGGLLRDANVAAALAKYPCNDTGNGARFIARFGDDFMFVNGLDWLAWDGQRWSADDGARLSKLAAQETAAAIAEESYALIKLPQESVADFEKRQASRWAFGRDSGNGGRLSNMLLQAAPHLTRDVDELDDQPRLLAVDNGTIRFKPAPAGEAVEADECLGFSRWQDRADLLTHLAPVAYDPRAQCPDWLKYLIQVQPDPETRAFLARLVGYTLTGLNSEECLVAFEGKGANGKSLFIDVLEMLLGSAAVGIDFATLLADERRSGSGPTPDLARLRGVRMVTAGEPERGAKLAEGRIKSITGGDKIVARKLNRDPFEFRSQFQLIVSWNTRPRVGGDDGIWRRILLLIWPKQILPRLSDGRPNPEWRRKEDMLADFRAELPGILNWALDGYADWAKGGLRPPPEVLQAVRSYRDQSDPVGSFIAEACDATDPSSTASAGSLYGAFMDWRRLQGWDGDFSQRRFGDALEERGHTKMKVGVIFRRGLELLPEWQVGGSARKQADTNPPADSYDDE